MWNLLDANSFDLWQASPGMLILLKQLLIKFHWESDFFRP
ncbi:hypothetical protein Pint_21817 [Pistacia integerrima]|uniref:Uncharacterized protein n=1 Tax=Pistacia integerrima TaxID=434235 RepID=A0ACC0XB60_9ROSI|nr:hypothetical protein Pint_21817 [Pistacia integerrima]